MSSEFLRAFHGTFLDVAPASRDRTPEKHQGDGAMARILRKFSPA
jgi:hypothetical protein